MERNRMVKMKIYLFFANNGFALGFLLMCLSLMIQMIQWNTEISIMSTTISNIIFGIGFFIMLFGFDCLYRRKWNISFTSLDNYEVVETKEMTGREALYYVKFNNYAWELIEK